MHIIPFIFFIFGSIIGSFLNVVILRFNTHRSFGGRSACMSCQKTLSWHELVPVVSYCVQGGKCKGCKSKVSVQYPLVEFTTGIIFVLLFVNFEYLFFSDLLSFAFTYAFYATLFSLLIVISVYDIKHKIIPDTLALVFGILAFVGLFFFDVYGFYPHLPLFSDILAGVVMSLPFALLWFFSQGTWMGLGDAKLAIGLGFLLGMSKILTAIAFAFWVGGIAGIILMLLSKGKYGIKSEIPFAPFLIFGATIAFFFEIYLFPIFNF